MANTTEQITEPRQIHGISLNIGVGLGRAIFHQPGGTKTPLNRIRFGGDTGKNGIQSLWQDRMSDFKDLSSRLKRYLTDSPVDLLRVFKGSPIIVIADHIGPAELLDYEREQLVGLVLGDQSPTSHVTIVARSLGIPVVGGMQNTLNDINPGDSILVNGNNGCVYIRPAKETIHYFNRKPSPKKHALLNNCWKKEPFFLQKHSMAFLFLYV